MKKFLIFAMAAMMAVSGQAKIKILEASSKKAPEWLGTSKDGYLVIQGYGQDLAAAQNDALVALKQQIAMGVATNVDATQTSEQVSQTATTENGLGVSEVDVFHNQVKMKAGKLPFLKGISLSNAQESYWVRQQDENGPIQYVYHVLYPFSKMDLESLIAEYDRFQAEKKAELKSLQDAVATIDNVQTIDINRKKVQALNEVFVDAATLSEVASLDQTYKSLYEYLTVGCTWTAPGEATVQLLLNGNPITCGIAPKIKLMNADGPDNNITIKKTNVGDATEVRFITEDIDPEDGYYLNISYAGIPGCTKAPTAKEPLDKKSGALEKSSHFLVVPTGTIALSAAENVGGKLKDITVVISLNNMGGTPYMIKGIELQVPDLVAPVNFEESSFPDGVYRTKGIKRITAKCEGTFDVRDVKTTAYDNIKGSINIVNPETNAVQSVPINNKFTRNW